MEPLRGVLAGDAEVDGENLGRQPMERARRRCDSRGDDTRDLLTAWNASAPWWLLARGVRRLGLKHQSNRPPDPHSGHAGT